jgi:hypothetical protein
MWGKPFVCTRIEHELEASIQNRKNWTLWFGKPDYPVLLILAAARGTASTQ